jgi:hypothetical protein
MKWQAVIVLVAIALTILVPPALPLMSVPGRHAQIGTLDVCHSALPAIAANGEMPCINSMPAVHRPTSFVTHTISQKPFFLQSLFTFDSEHPPKA